MKRVAKSLPNSPRKKRFVIGKMTEEIGLKVTGIHQKVRTGISPKQIDHVQKNKISWQAPGRKDRVLSQEVLSNGETLKKTCQVYTVHAYVTEVSISSISGRNER